jgi:hypothetical protein
MPLHRISRTPISLLTTSLLALTLFARGTAAPVARADENDDRWARLAVSTADPEAAAAAIADLTGTAAANGESSSRVGNVVVQTRDESGRDDEAARWSAALEAACARLEAAGYTLAADSDTVLIHLRPPSGPAFVATSRDGSVILIREPVSTEPPQAPALPKRADGPLLLRDVVTATDRARVQAQFLAFRRAKAAGPGSASNGLARRAVTRASLPDKLPPWLFEAIVAWVEEAAFPAAKAAPLHVCGGATGKAFAPAALFDPKASPTPAQARVLGRLLGSLAGDKPDLASAVSSVIASADPPLKALSDAFKADAAAALATLLKATPADPKATCDASATVPCPVCRGAGRLDVACPACVGSGAVACPACLGAADCWSPHCVDGVQRFWRDATPTDCKLCRGRGWYFCEPCKATGRTTCKVCGGGGRATWPCLSCSGKGRLPCPDAGATSSGGPGAAAAPCTWCRGASVLVACPTCGGAGFAGCRSCHGSLKTMCPECFGLGCKKCNSLGFDFCVECDKGRLPCSCGGKGSVRLESERCPGCDGSGLAGTASQAARRLEQALGGLPADELQKNADMLAKAVQFLLSSTSGSRFALRENRMTKASPTPKILVANEYSNALVLWCLFTTGLTPKSEELAGPWRSLQSDAMEISVGSTKSPPSLQEAALVLRALVAGGSPADGTLVAGLVGRLAKAQRPSGFWAQDLVSKDAGDAYESLFAIETLWLARRAGAKVPGDVWSRALDSSSRLTGAISKSKGKNGWLSATDVASSAALAAIAKAGATAEIPHLDDVRSVSSVQQALAWLDRRFEMGRQPVVSGGARVTSDTDAGFGAYLYSLQRLCQLLSIDTIGDQRWHRAGARKLREMQLQDGAFEELGVGRLNGPVRTTVAAVLFLVKATPPLTEAKADASDSR